MQVNNIINDPAMDGLLKLAAEDVNDDNKEMLAMKKVEKRGE